MKNRIAHLEERQFITKEFAETMAGKGAAPYFRLHDPVQRALVEAAADHHRRYGSANPYFNRMIHFWREVSLSGIHRTGESTDQSYAILRAPPGATPKKHRSMDECYALLFESAFDLAEAQPGWAANALSGKGTSHDWLLDQIDWQIPNGDITHGWMANAFTSLYAPRREWEQKWQHASCVALHGEACFWAALQCSVTGQDHRRLEFRHTLRGAAGNLWGDRRLHTRLIREAAQHAEITRRDELMAHPLLRLARLKYTDGSVEQSLVLKFLNARCIKEGFSSEEDYFWGDLTLAQWLRDARVWAEEMLLTDPQTCQAMFEEDSPVSTQSVRDLLQRELGPDPAAVDNLDATAALMKWAKRNRGFEVSRYRAEVWEFIIEVTDAALWLGWLFPRPSGASFFSEPAAD